MQPEQTGKSTRRPAGRVCRFLWTDVSDITYLMLDLPPFSTLYSQGNGIPGSPEPPRGVEEDAPCQVNFQRRINGNEKELHLSYSAQRNRRSDRSPRRFLREEARCRDRALTRVAPQAVEE
jgi:hypothetical protein